MFYLLKKININFLILFIILSIAILYGIGKDLRQYERAGDSAIFEQLLYNIAEGKGSVSNVFANTQHYIETYLGKTPIDLIEKNDHLELNGPVIDERNMLKFHAYYVLYPISIFSKIIDSSLLLAILQSLTFFCMLLVLYFFIANKSSKFLALIFVFIVFCNPNWYGGIQGWFYPDKLFVIFAILFCIAIYEKSLKYLILLSFIMILINERAALISGVVLMFYLVSFSFYNNFKAKNFFDIKLFLIALVLIIYSYITKNYILDNVYYGGSYLPANFNDLMLRLQTPDFVNKIYINLVNNSPLLLLLLFSKRFILGALFVLSLNIIGNIGGAEKIGWTTHYHSYYFPIIAFAAAVGYINIINKIKQFSISNNLKVFIKFISVGLVFGIFLLHQQYKINKLDITPLGSFVKYYDTVVYYLKTTESGYSDKLMLKKIIEPNTLVCTTEFGMAMLYQNNKVSFFPIDIDKADYVFIPSDYEFKDLNINNQKIKFYDWLETKHFDTKNVIKINKFGQSIFKKIEDK